MSDQRAFDRVLIIVFENQYRSYVMKNHYMRGLAEKGIELKNHFGNMHPSQTNYISSVAGELCNLTWDWPPVPAALPQETIVDRLESAGLEWKAYMQNYVKVPWSKDINPITDYAVPFPIPEGFWDTWKLNEQFKLTAQPPYPYAYWHNPFSMFQRNLDSRERWDKIEDESAFWRDLMTGSLPEYAWFSPNLWNDGHYKDGTGVGDKQPKRAPFLVDQAAAWLESFFDVLKIPGKDSLLPPRTLVVVTFDEADFEAGYVPPGVDTEKSNYDGPNQIYTVLLGDVAEGNEDAVERGIEEGGNHYTMLKSIEQNFGLTTLGKNDRDANWWQALWGKRFGWGKIRETDIVASATFAAAGLGDQLYVVYAAPQGGGLSLRTFDGTRWSSEQAIFDDASAAVTGVALVASGSKLVLVYNQADSGLTTLVGGADGDWTAISGSDPEGAVDAFSLITLDDGTPMLAYAQGNVLFSTRFVGKGWAAATEVPHKTGGDLTLVRLGASIYLIHKAFDGDHMNVVSYNTADFNVLDIAPSPPPHLPPPLAAIYQKNGPANNTTKDMWSPSEYPVAHYSHGPNRETPGEQEPRLLPYPGRAPLGAATLDGVIHLIHPEASGARVLTESFSLSGILTPKNPVSYGSTDEDPTSNGYGTLAQAGWSQQRAIDDAYCHPAGGLAIARVGSRLALLFQPEDDGRLYMVVGEYAGPTYG